MNDDSQVAATARRRPPHDLSQDVTSFDSGAVFLVKALFYPVTTVALFALCLSVGGQNSLATRAWITTNRHGRNSAG